MLETLLAPLGSLVVSTVMRLAGKPYFRLHVGVATPEYEGRQGGYLALGVKVGNIGKETAYFDRIEAVLKSGERRLVHAVGVTKEAPVHPNRSIAAFVPAKLLLEPDVVDIEVYDAVERRYRLGRGNFRKVQSELAGERGRLLAAGYKIDWQP